MPISPQQVLEKQKDIKLTEAEKIPDFVYDVFDKLIAENFDTGLSRSVVWQDRIVKLIGEVDPSFPIKWLDVEPKYRSLGWDVQYFKAPYYETGSSYFVFSIKL